jgi:pyruvate,water dikinase
MNRTPELSGNENGALVRSTDIEHADQVGGKAAALARLGAAGFPVPDWFVVPTWALERGSSEAQRTRLGNDGNDGDDRDDGDVDDVRVAPTIRAEIEHALPKLASSTFAVRSSAVDEDSREHSFAGQLESYLFVSAADVPRRIVDVWRSAFHERVRTYRREHGLPSRTARTAVIVQRMIDADASGVAFSADPVTGDRDTVVIASVHGVGAALVSGEAAADTHHVDRRGRIVRRSIASKNREHGGSGAGPEAIDVKPHRVDRPALQDEEIVAVAALARRAARLFGCPQDIEWAIESGRLFLLQSRPITSLRTAGASGARAIWDNSNIVESYPGITSPLTYTFARNAYEGVYGQLARILGVPAKRVETNRDALAGMLGLIHGRIYYNLTHWYRLLAMLPGYEMNRAFFDQMIGVRERSLDDLPTNDAVPSWWVRAIDGVRFVRSAIGMGVPFLVLPATTKRFDRRVDEALRPTDGDLVTLSTDELASAYRRIENGLMGHWDAPNVNDFFAMIFYGVLRRLSARWCGDAEGTLPNGLLAGSGGMVSAEPAARVEEMAAIARAEPELVEVLLRASPEYSLDAILASHAAFRDRYESYLRKFGDRCAEELKLESRTLREDPSMLLRSIGGLAESPVPAAPTKTASGHGDDERRRAGERVVRERLGRAWWKRVLFASVLGQTRRFVRGRENMRLQRTRVFGRVRGLFAELGVRFHELGVLRDPRDIFFLAMEEVLGFVDGTAVWTDLAKIVAMRKEEFAGYSEMEPPADRFETRGPVHGGNTFRSPARLDEGGDLRQGTGCCPGRVVGRVRVVRNPATAVLRRGDILVAEHTDPSWVMLFPFAKGLLVERGSLLSHSAIVARELGIPAIVAIGGLTRWLEDGDRVEFDGASGRVRKLGAAEESS